MEVQNQYIPEEKFSEFLRSMPQVSVELVAEHDKSVLLVKRLNEPAKDEWFWPGSRLYKGETFEDAVDRIAEEELGIDVEICCQLGTYSHFWDTGAFENVNSTHTVNVVYHVHPEDDFEISLDDQHDDYKFISETSPELHEYVNTYIGENDILNFFDD